MAKALSNKKKAHLTGKLDLNLKNKQVNLCISNIDCYAAKNWTLCKVDQNYLGSF
jgi:hypothetical protein